MSLTMPLADDAAIFEYSYTTGNSSVYQLAGAWGGFFTLITTTDIHLPRRIGAAVKRAFHGRLEEDFDDAGYFARVTWTAEKARSPRRQPPQSPAENRPQTRR